MRGPHLKNEKNEVTNQVALCAEFSNVGIFRLCQSIWVFVNARNASGSDRLEDIDNFLLLLRAVVTRPIGLAPTDAVHGDCLVWEAKESSTVPDCCKWKKRKKGVRDGRPSSPLSHGTASSMPIYTTVSGVASVRKFSCRHTWVTLRVAYLSSAHLGTQLRKGPGTGRVHVCQALYSKLGLSNGEAHGPSNGILGWNLPRVCSAGTVAWQRVVLTWDTGRSLGICPYLDCHRSRRGNAGARVILGQQC